MELMRDKVLAMGAGRKMDASIAIGVFGWDGERVGEAMYAWENGVCGTETIPYYSTHIFAAWEVLEKLVDNGFTVGASKYAENNLYYAHVLKNGVDICDVQMMSSAPEAICKAALLTTLTEQEDNQ